MHLNNVTMCQDISRCISISKECLDVSTKCQDISLHCIVNGTILFVRSRWLEQGATWPLWSYDAIGISITWSHWLRCHVMPWHWCQHHGMQTALLVTPSHSLGQENLKEVQHYFFWSCRTIGSGIGATWYQWHCQWHPCIP